MNGKAFIQEFIIKMNQIEELLLVFLNNNDLQQKNFEKIINFFDNHKICHNKHDFKIILRLLSILSSNHHRSCDFFSKINQILNHIKTEIHQNFTNYEIFNIFKSSKRILLSLFEEKILIPDQTLYSLIKSKSKYEQMNFSRFFSTEFKNQLIQNLNDERDSELFNEKRENGENDDYLCQLIRNDSVNEFIDFVSRNDIKLSASIKNSIFETNSFLIGKQPSLIEYSAFFGSFQIIKYLYSNNVALSSSLWSYAIHGDNPEMIHFLEEKEIKPNDPTFKEIYIESIKCHHNEIAKYIKENFLQNSNESDFHLFVSKSLKYVNFQNEFYDVSEILNESNILYDSCRYDYFQIIQSLSSIPDFDMKSKIIFY